MKQNIFGILQRIGRSFMLPIAILPVAGLLLGLGGSLTNETMLETYGLRKIMGAGTIPYGIFTVMSKAGNVVFENLPLLFAIGVAIGMAKKEKEVAALAGAIAFFIMHAAINALLTLRGGTGDMLSGATASVCGITSLQMGVFGGMMVGLGVAALHNRFYKIQLPQMLSFFGGTRFVPIISALVYTGVGILMYFIWPVIQTGIYALGDMVLESGYAGTWVYGLMERLLLPFGLHHVFYLPFWQTALGGTMEIQGVLVSGAQNIFFAQLADPKVTRFATSATRFMSGKFPLMIFGLPGAALAMYRAAKREKRDEVGGLLLSAALTSMLTGITEPLEFTFLFVAPLLYGIHCVLAGASYMLMHILKVGVGMTFSGGFIDLFLFGILQGNRKTNWIWVIVVGAFYFMIYYFLFYLLITKLDLRTPGREDSKDVKLYSRRDLEEKNQQKAENEKEDSLSRILCDGLGGKKNISDVDCCATRLRCTVYQAELVDDGLLKSTGASGVVHKGTGVQIIYGPKVTVIKSNLEDYLETEPEKTIREVSEEVKENGMDGKMETNRKEQKTSSTILIHSPVTGIVAPLSTAPDEAFAEKMMGDGAVIIPLESKVCAPEDGKIAFVFETKHAMGFLTDSGINMLLHMGIDTVRLKGEGFRVFVENGQEVKKGEMLMELDLSYIKEHAPSLASPILCTELEDNQVVRLLTEGPVKQGDPLFVIEQTDITGGK